MLLFAMKAALKANELPRASKVATGQNKPNEHKSVCSFMQGIVSSLQ